MPDRPQVVEVEWPDLGAHWIALETNRYPDEHVHALPQVGVALRASRDLVVSTRGLRGQLRHERVPAGAAFLTPAGEPHALDFTGSSEIVLIEFGPNLVDPGDPVVRSAIDCLRPPGIVVDPVLASFAAALAAEFQAGRPPSRLYLESMALVVAAHLLRRYTELDPAARPTPALGGERLGRVLEYVDAGMAGDLSVATLAEVAGISPFHFGRLFKIATGQTPHQYVLARRLARGNSLLRSTDWSIARIAREVGFADQSHFTRQFARRFGQTPGCVVRHRTYAPAPRTDLQDAWDDTP